MDDNLMNAASFFASTLDSRNECKSPFDGRGRPYLKKYVIKNAARLHADTKNYPKPYSIATCLASISGRPRPFPKNADAVIKELLANYKKMNKTWLKKQTKQDFQSPFLFSSRYLELSISVHERIEFLPVSGK